MPLDSNGLENAELDRVMKEVPRGAFALAGTAVALLLVAWLAIYLFLCVPRGPVG